jgi:hypothetical protein
MERLDLKKTEEIERDALLKVKDELYKHLQINLQKDNYNVYFLLSNIDTMTNYDALIHIYSTEGNKYHSYIIECKVRDTHYDELMIERKKFNKLIKYENIQKSFGFHHTQVLYLNFTPKGTFVFKIRGSEYKAFKWLKETHNCSTEHKRLGKETKWVAYLDTYDNEMCTKLDYIYDYKIEELKVQKKLEKQDRVRCIFESINKKIK